MAISRSRRCAFILNKADCAITPALPDEMDKTMSHRAGSAAPSCQIATAVRIAALDRARADDGGYAWTAYREPLS